jgi:hypothetical protein
MSHHVGRGHILKIKDTTKMTDKIQELADSLEFVEKYSLDENGEVIIIKVY